MIKKILMTACVAAYAFFGMQSSTAIASDNEVLNINDESMQFVEDSSENPDRKVSSDLLKEPIVQVSMSAEEKVLLARLVEAEAKGESYEGKVAVATVVLNRVDSPEFPDSITNVIYEVVGDAYAFSPVQNGEINKPASNESIKAVKDAQIRTDRLNNAVYFYNNEIATDEWIRTREVVKTIGNHVFAI